MMDYTPNFWFLEKDSPPGRKTTSTIKMYLSEPLYRTTSEAIITSAVLILMYSNILSCMCYFTSHDLGRHRKLIKLLFAIHALGISLNPTWAAACPEVMKTTICPYFQMTDFFGNYIMAMFGILSVYPLALWASPLASALRELYKEHLRPRTLRQGHGWEVTPPDVDPYESRVVR